MNLISQLILRERIQKAITSIILEAAEDRAKSYGATDDMIEAANNIIASIPQRNVTPEMDEEEKRKVRNTNQLLTTQLKEKTLDWAAKIFVENEKNKEKNKKSIEAGFQPNLPEYKAFAVELFQIILMYYIQNTFMGKGKGIDLKAVFNIKNIETEAQRLKADIKAEVIDEFFSGWEFSKEFVKAKTNKYEIVASYEAEESEEKKPAFTHPWYEHRWELMQQIKGKLDKEDILYRYKDGKAMVLLNTKEKINREGGLQNLCLKGKANAEFDASVGIPKEEGGSLIHDASDSYINNVQNGKIILVSLRTPDNIPIGTMNLNLENLNFTEQMAKHNVQVNNDIKALNQEFLREFMKDKIDDYIKEYKEKGLKASQLALIVLTRSEASPVEIIKDIAEKTDDVALISYLMQNKSTPTDVAEKLLMEKSSLDTKKTLAATSDNQELLVKFIDDDSHDVRLSLASNDKADGKILHALAAKSLNDSVMLEQLARNTGVKYSTLELIYNNTDHTDIVKLIAVHINTKHSLLKAIWDKFNFDMAAEITQKRKSPGGGAIIDSLAEHTLLDEIAKGEPKTEQDKNLWIISLENISQHKNTKVETILFIMFNILNTGLSTTQGAARTVTYVQIISSIFENRRIYDNVNALQRIINDPPQKLNIKFVLTFMAINKNISDDNLIKICELIVNNVHIEGTDTQGKSNNFIIKRCVIESMIKRFISNQQVVAKFIMENNIDTDLLRHLATYEYVDLKLDASVRTAAKNKLNKIKAIK